MKLLPALFILAFALMPAAAKAKTNIDACLSKSKEYFNEKEYSLAEKTLNGCLKTNPKNADALISLAGVEMILGKFNNAEKNFIKALSYLNAKSPYKAYIYSRLGDIYMRKANLKEAEKYYKTARIKLQEGIKKSPSCHGRAGLVYRFTAPERWGSRYRVRRRKLSHRCPPAPGPRRPRR